MRICRAACPRQPPLYALLTPCCAIQASVEMGLNKDGVRATLATRDIREGEVIGHVPANLTITLATVSDHSIQARAGSPPLQS